MAKVMKLWLGLSDVARSDATLSIHMTDIQSSTDCGHRDRYNGGYGSSDRAGRGNEEMLYLLEGKKE
jgi:hypothetical protein